jgi:hypothetical protein
MSITVELPYLGETFKSTLKLDVFDKEGELVRVDEADTWYEVVDTRLKWEKFDNSLTPHLWVICDLVRIDEESEKLDEPTFEVIYHERHFTV